MANFTTVDVEALREQIGTGMTDAKKTLTEADGDAEKALEVIRLKGLKSLSKREDRQTSAGLLVAEIEGGIGVFVEISSETDFVTKSQKFIGFANEVLVVVVTSKAADPETLLTAPMGGETVRDKLNGITAIIGEKLEIRRVAHIEGKNADLYLHQTSSDLSPQIGVFVVTDVTGTSVAHNIAMRVAVYVPAYLDRDHVPVDVFERERTTLMKTTLGEDKPEKIVDKIVTDRLEAYSRDDCLVDQTFTRDPSESVRKVLEETGARVANFVCAHIGA